MTEVLLHHAARGAAVIRLDAIAFLWRASGTSCLHLPQTHEVVRLWRTVLDHWAPGTLLITETNVPHRENVTYFGAGDQAHLGCHDGIGLRPAEGLLSASQVTGLCDLAIAAGGGVSYRAAADGSQTPYELNTTYLDALPAVADDDLAVTRITGAHAILLAPPARRLPLIQPPGPLPRAPRVG